MIQSESQLINELKEIQEESIGYLDFVLDSGRTMWFFWTRLPKILWYLGRLGWATYILHGIERNREGK